ncbi:hypothetical protein H0H81_008454 [Sphagnurus paluster]|uniref:Uncharacterized protein n=1 Tax=Sphagnurus paluster TaxID=117069 RepID=A0A9P7K7B7_9AGAR|nr:hypothetical protein H0H81_008454 [Sphagnurus paluster]
MPGPSNIKKKQKIQKRGKQKNSKACPSAPGIKSPSSLADRGHDGNNSPFSRSPSRLLTPPANIQVSRDINIAPEIEVFTQYHEYAKNGGFHREDIAPEQKAEVAIGWEPQAMPPQVPFIHDPGNGPRVRDTRAFIESKFFSQPPALDIPLCAEFAQGEVLQMLMTVLPEETALILWYNKSRATSRICPACQRLYRLGDILPDHLPDEVPTSPKEVRPSPQLRREQTISGLCSPVCFILASFNYPGAIRSAWGRTEDELDDYTWGLLNGPAESNAQGAVSMGLSMLMKMSRLHDLGLAQLCLGMNVEDVDGFDADDECVVDLELGQEFPVP